jgi:hypothetical protein
MIFPSRTRARIDGTLCILFCRPSKFSQSPPHLTQFNIHTS